MVVGPQREGLRRILHGEATTPGATHFYVYNSTADIDAFIGALLKAKSVFCV